MNDPNEIPPPKSLKGVATTKKFEKLKIRKRYDSNGTLEELIQCGICLEKLRDNRMLPCQHTFCLFCLKAQIIARTALTPSGDNSVLRCPLCQIKVNLDKGVDSLDELPKNLYIDSLMKVVEGKITPITPPPPDYRCFKCQTFSQNEEQCCQHCLKVFCNVCWNDHLSELEANLAILLKQVTESKQRLDHKLENFENKCENLTEQIKTATLQKIDMLRMAEEAVLEDVVSLTVEGKKCHENINNQIVELGKKLDSYSLGKNKQKVSTFMQLHEETSKILNRVNHFCEARIIFDPDAFKLDQDTEGIYDYANDSADTADNHNPLVSQDCMMEHYKNRSYIPKVVWKKCPRPGHAGVAPWDNNLLYIAATDTRTVLIFNRHSTQLEGRLTHADMLYPQGVAFSKKLQEIYISDKWKHCIHVFNRNGEYQRSLLSKGNGEGRVWSPDGIVIGPNEELVVSDSGNNRIIVIDPKNSNHLSTIGVINKKTILNTPTGIAVIEDKIVVADTGNHKIKIFDIQNNLLGEFGALGRERGKFRSAEAVAIDSMGLILVGDGGNGRVQVFKSDGTLIKVFGGRNHGEFGWISGIVVTEDLDIIVTDSKTRRLVIF